MDNTSSHSIIEDAHARRQRGWSGERVLLYLARRTRYMSERCCQELWSTPEGQALVEDCLDQCQDPGRLLDHLMGRHVVASQELLAEGALPSARGLRQLGMAAEQYRDATQGLYDCDDDDNFPPDWEWKGIADALVERMPGHEGWYQPLMEDRPCCVIDAMNVGSPNLHSRLRDLTPWRTMEDIVELYARGRNLTRMLPFLLEGRMASSGDLIDEQVRQALVGRALDENPSVALDDTLLLLAIVKRDWTSVELIRSTRHLAGDGMSLGLLETAVRRMTRKNPFGIICIPLLDEEMAEFSRMLGEELPVEKDLSMTIELVLKDPWDGQVHHCVELKDLLGKGARIAESFLRRRRLLAEYGQIIEQRKDPSGRRGLKM